MSNIDFWFYTLSSISQTIAAVVALSAMFGIFKLDHMQRNRQTFITEMSRFMMLLNYHLEIHQILKQTKTDKGVQMLLGPIDKLDNQKDDLGLGDEVYQKCAEEMNNTISGYRGKYHSNRERIYGYLKEQTGRFEALICIKTKTYRKLLKSTVLNILVIIVALSLIPLPSSGINSSVSLVYCVIAFAAIALIYTSYCILRIAKYDL